MSSFVIKIVNSANGAVMSVIVGCVSARGDFFVAAVRVPIFGLFVDKLAVRAPSVVSLLKNSTAYKANLVSSASSRPPRYVIGLGYDRLGSLYITANGAMFACRYAVSGASGRITCVIYIGVSGGFTARKCVGAYRSANAGLVIYCGVLAVGGRFKVTGVFDFLVVYVIRKSAYGYGRYTVNTCVCSVSVGFMRRASRDGCPNFFVRKRRDNNGFRISALAANVHCLSLQHIGRCYRQCIRTVLVLASFVVIAGNQQPYGQCHYQCENNKQNFVPLHTAISFIKNLGNYTLRSHVFHILSTIYTIPLDKFYHLHTPKSK